MSLDKRNHRYCDECGRTIQKAHRIFNGKDYCSVCYPRVFPKVECTVCHGSARPHRYSNSPPICRACDIKARKCVRCEKGVPKAGKLINGRPVCPSCVPYFNEPQKCTSCGKFSIRVLRAIKFGLDNPMCESCRRKLTHKTCIFCRKYRLVQGITDEGKEYCASCIPGKQQSHLCPSCGTCLPGSGKSRCRSCITLARLVKEADLHALALNRTWARQLLVDFAIELHEKSGHQPNCFSLFLSHESFFERLDAHFEKIEDIDETSLLEHLGVAFLRQHLLPTKFLLNQLGIKLSSEAKLDSAERARMQDKLVKNTREVWSSLLKNYHIWLSAQDLSLLTQRLYLRAAEKFCQSEKIKENTAFSENMICTFLKKHPGSRASLYKFITYCRKELGWDIRMPNKPASPPTSLPRKLKTLMQLIKTNGIEGANTDLLSKVLALAFGYELKQFLSYSWSFSEVDGTTILSNDVETIEVPTGYIDIARSWTAKQNQ